MRKKSDFTATHWTLIVRARGGSSQARQALNQLCARYWYPLYVFVRKTNHSPQDAEDLTQAFFVHLFRKNFLAKVTPDKGRFRSFLLTCLKHFLDSKRQRSRAKKRMPPNGFIFLEGLTAEQRYALEPKELLDPEKLAERAWALTLLGHVLKQLQAEQIAAGNGELFKALQPLLLREEEGVAAVAASQLGISPDAVRVRLYRLRKRFRALLLREISRTVATDEDVQDELRHLFSVLGGNA